MEEAGPEEFDFKNHRDKAVLEYTRVRQHYENFAKELENLFKKCLEAKSIKFYSIQARAKEIDSFADKASKPLETNQNLPKYLNPLSDITDITGVRIIVFFLDTINDVDQLINDEFDVIEKSDKYALLEKEEKLGYQSVHYLIKLKKDRSDLIEYSKYSDLIAELQVRTILQHAWAEIEHDIKYKSVTTLPSSIKRRFIDLAGLLEISDREFQSIQDEHVKITKLARENVNRGELKGVEITPDALETYLNKKFGVDNRVSDYSYVFEAENLADMGFVNIKQIDDCISGYDDDIISKLIYGHKQGQVTRFQQLLLAGLGEEYIKRHPYTTLEQFGNHDFWKKYWTDQLTELKKAGIETGKYKLKTSFMTS